MKKNPYKAIIDRSIKRDFKSDEMYNGIKKVPEIENIDKLTGRIQRINPSCCYSLYARYFVGKIVKCVKRISGETGYYEFIHDEDRKALNNAAGWSDLKTRYLLEKPIIK